MWCGSLEQNVDRSCAREAIRHSDVRGCIGRKNWIPSSRTTARSVPRARLDCSCRGPRGTYAVGSLPAIAWRLNAGSAPVIIIAGVITSVVLALLVRSTIDQRVLAREIREREARHLAVFEGSRDAIGVSKHGIHVYANPSYLRLFGYENKPSIVGTRIIDSIAPRLPGPVLENVERRAAGEQVPEVLRRAVPEETAVNSMLK